MSIFLILNKTIIPIKYWTKIITPEILMLIKNAVRKENYLTPEDAELINKFINKIKTELEN